MLEKMLEKMHEEEIKKEIQRDHQFSMIWNLSNFDSSHRLAIGMEQPGKTHTTSC